MNLGKIGMSDTSYKTKLKDMFTHNDDKMAIRMISVDVFGVSIAS